MNCLDFGSFLREKRLEKGLSLKAVQQITQITDSRLSRAERGDEILKWTPQDLRRLAEVYGISNVDMCIAAGYITENDLEQYRKVFTGTEFLTKAEMSNTQEQINLFIAGRRKNDI